MAAIILQKLAFWMDQNGQDGDGEDKQHLNVKYNSFVAVEYKNIKWYQR